MTLRLSRNEAIPALLKDLRGLRRRKESGRPVFVAVVGGSASGKGHLIDELLAKLNAPDAPPDQAAVLPLDNYYRDATERALRGAPHFDHPDALDLELAASQIARMHVGKTYRIPSYDFTTGQRGAPAEFTAKRHVLIDGLFALYAPEIRALCDYAVFIDTDHYSAMLRRLFRDPGPDGRTKQSSREVLEQYFTQVWPAKRTFIDPTAQHAQMIVESRYAPALEAGRAGHMQCQLKARGWRDDDHVAALAKATRLGAKLRQIDRFMRPRGRDNADELLRVRIENGELSLTYKGPFVPNADGVGMRPVTSPIELPEDALRAWRFGDDYETVGTLKKTRTLFQAGGVLIARDQIDGLGDFIEVRTDDPGEAKRLPGVLSALCPQEPQIEASYLDLWRRASLTTSP